MNLCMGLGPHQYQKKKHEFVYLFSTLNAFLFIAKLVLFSEVY
jgi:hypothetical protein